MRRFVLGASLLLVEGCTCDGTPTRFDCPLGRNTSATYRVEFSRPYYPVNVEDDGGYRVESSLVWTGDAGPQEWPLGGLHLEDLPLEYPAEAQNPEFVPTNGLFATIDGLDAGFGVFARGGWFVTDLALQATHWSHFEVDYNRTEDWLTDADGGLLFAEIQMMPTHPGGRLEVHAQLPFSVSWLQCGLGPEAEVVFGDTHLTQGRATLEAQGQRWLVSVDDAQVIDFQNTGEVAFKVAREGFLHLGTP